MRLSENVCLFVTVNSPRMMNAFINHYLVFILAFVDRFDLCRSLMFEVVPDLTTAENARSRCNAMGLELAMIKDRATMEKVNDFYTETPSIPGNLWFGLVWNVDAQAFYWVDGEKLDSSDQYWNWYTTNVDDPEPNYMQTPTYNTNPENCVRLYTQGSWKTIHCANKYGVLCMGYGDETTSLTTTAYNTIPSTEDGGTTHKDTSPDSTLYSTTTSTDNVDSFTTSPEISTNSKMITHGTNISSTIPAGSRAIVFCPYDAVNICDCDIVKNLSHIEHKAPDDHIYKIDKKKTSAYIRKHNSAYDGRFSAKVMGLTGSAVLVIVGLLVCCIDITRMLTLKKNFNN